GKPSSRRRARGSRITVWSAFDSAPDASFRKYFQSCNRRPLWANAMNDLSVSSQIAYRAAQVQPRVVRRIRGLSDTALAWLFITPTIVLLLAINIFPLIWTVYLSFTNYRANRPNVLMRWMGIDWYQSILTDPDIWSAMQVTAHFVFWTVVIETVLGFGLA